MRDLEESHIENTLDILPYVAATINATANGKLGISYGKSIQRPSIFQLNPNVTILDPYTSYQGNSGLESAIHNTLSLNYSTTMNNNFISMGTFYEQSSNCMENLVTVSEELQSMHIMQNLGSIEKLGIKLLGSVKPLKNVSFNPFIKAYGAFTRGNELAREHGIEDRNRMVLESGFSMSALFKKDFVLSTMFKYNSSRVRIQGSHLEDVLYFISLEKTFKDKFMIGLTSALPFSKEFTYRGYETIMPDYREYSEDNLQLSLFPVWLKFKYTFSTGRKTKRIERSNDFSEASIKKGLFK